MSIDIKKQLVDDIRSQLRDMDQRKIKISIAFTNLEKFLSKKSTQEEIDSKTLHQFRDESRSDITQDISDISDELANVYPLIEMLMKNNKLFALEMAQPERQSLGQRLKNMVTGSNESKFTMIQNPLTINIDLIEEARTLPKIWEAYLWDMRTRFILEASYWKSITMQMDNLVLERDYLFGIVKPRIQKLFMAAKNIIEEKTVKLEANILIREITDEMKMLPFGQPAAPAQKQETTPTK